LSHKVVSSSSGLFTLMLVCVMWWHIDCLGNVITNQSPALQIIGVGSNATFFVQASSSATTYQWQFNNSPIIAATNSSLTLTNIGYTNDGCYVAVVTGNGGSETSSCMQLIAMDLPRALNATNMSWTIGGLVNWTWQTNTSVDGVAGVSGILPVVTFHSSYAEATIIGPGTLNFSWMMAVGTPNLDDQEFALNGVNRATLSGVTSWVQNGPWYLADGTNVMRWTYNGNYYAYLDQVSFVPGATAPILTTGPSNQVVAAGSSVTLGATANGTLPLQYQWQFFGTNLPNATNTSLTISDAQAVNEGTYTIVVTNSAGNGSASAIVTVSNGPPVFTRQPASTNVLVGMPTAFKCGLKGSEPFTYQWFFNGAPSPGATGNPLVITNVNMTNAGGYQLAVSNAYGNALSSTGFLYAGHTMVVGWGQNLYSGPPAPLGLTNAVQLAVNVYLVSALKSDGRVTSWGLNEYGLIAYVANLSNIVSIATGGPHELALTRDGTVIGWGYNYFGSANVPPGLSNVVAISANGYLSMALRNDGKVFCWGENNLGQTNVPANLSNVVAIAAGPDHCVALRRDGTVATWGNGTVQYPPPANLSNVVAIAAGGSTSQAIKSDGTIVAWGNPQETNVPPGISNLFQVVEGQAHNLAVRNDGTATAWLYADGPSYDHGQANVPLWVSNVVSIAANYNLSMAIMADTPPLSHAPSISPTKLAPGAPFQVQIPTQNGRVYGLEYSDSLPVTNWKALPLQAGTGGMVTFSDSSATNTARYYRIRRW